MAATISFLIILLLWMAFRVYWESTRKEAFRRLLAAERDLAENVRRISSDASELRRELLDEFGDLSVDMGSEPVRHTCRIVSLSQLSERIVYEKQWNRVSYDPTVGKVAFVSEMPVTAVPETGISPSDLRDLLAQESSIVPLKEERESSGLTWYRGITAIRLVS